MGRQLGEECCSSDSLCDTMRAAQSYAAVVVTTGSMIEQGSSTWGPQERATNNTS
jgi:hypothetical protein